MQVLIIAPILAGAVLLLSALLPVRRIIGYLPHGRVRRNWYFLTGLILFFILGYLVYTAIIWNQSTSPSDLVVTLVFFFGACFVFIVNTFSSQTAADIRRISDLEKENIQDPLMNLYNRRYFDRRLEEEFARARRYDLPLSILLIDLDNFKQVNDRHGHQCGDVVLENLGKLIITTVRHSDIVARYGGDEIVIIAPNTQPGTAGLLAERIRLAIKNSPREPMDGTVDHLAPPITASIGVSYLHDLIKDIRGLVKCADQAMYRAKQDGRDRIVIADSPCLE